MSCRVIIFEVGLVQCRTFVIKIVEIKVNCGYVLSEGEDSGGRMPTLLLLPSLLSLPTLLSSFLTL